MKLHLAFIALLSAIAIDAYCAKPNLEFGPGGVTILDVQPGTKIAWMSLTRTRIANHASVRIDRGIDVATQSKKAVIARAGADQSRSLWVLAAVDEDLAGAATAPTYGGSPFPIDVTAPAGSATISVVSPEVELVYVRPKGGAWFISATDGGIGDVDHVQNTVVTIALDSLERLQGNPHPPDVTAPGDIILMIDPRTNRTSVVKVSP